MKKPNESAFIAAAEMDEQPVKRKVGNPRPVKNKACSFSVPLVELAKLDALRIELQEQGIYGITRSEVVTIALKNLTEAKLLKGIKELKAIK